MQLGKLFDIFTTMHELVPQKHHDGKDSHWHCGQIFLLPIKHRDAAVTMKCDYILGEYTNLMDAWKVYQGVALYRFVPAHVDRRVS